MKNRNFILVCMMLAEAVLASGYMRAQTATSTTARAELFKPPFNGPAERVHSTQYDFSDVANSLTAGCTDNYSKIKAIYEWICDHIDYDFSYSIHSADSCYMMRRGVCQGYCELFYRIAEAAGLKVELIAGESKNVDGMIGNGGHMWLFAYTRDNYGILIDPTWGSGYLQEDRKYKKNPDKWEWFNVNPEWMLFTHYPDHEHYQLIDNPLTREEFLALPTVNPLYHTYGLDTHRLFQMALEHRLRLPVFYNRGEGIFQLIDIPLCTSLKIGETYTFRVKMNNQREFAILNNPVLCRKNEWKSEGNGVYSIQFMPRATDKLLISLKNLEVENRWDNMVEYAIEPPTAADWDNVERLYPLSVPDATHVGNINAEAWQLCGIDGHRLLALIREHHVDALPTLYHDKGQKFDIILVPMNKKLKSGTPYTFRIRPKNGLDWVVVTNRKNWFTDWTIDKDGIHTMTVTPEGKGVLEIYTKMKENNQYWTSMAYEVE